MDPALLRRTAEIAAEYLASLPDRPVRAGASLDELRSGLRIALEDRSRPALQVIEELVAAADPGLVGTQSPRYFGFVIGGALDAAIAADWLTSVWDQNAAGYPGGPSAAVAEEVACAWLLDVLGLPDDAGVGLTTGCQMAHFTCLAAARHRALADAGWDVEADGLFGAPPIRVFVGAKAHTTVFAALRMLGLGSRRVELVAADDQGRMRAAALARVLSCGEGPAIVVAQVGEVNTGAIDAVPVIARLARGHMRGVTSTARSGCGRRRARRCVGSSRAWPSGLVGHRRAQVAQRPVRLWCRDRPRPDAHAAAMNWFVGRNTSRSRSTMSATRPIGYRSSRVARAASPSTPRCGSWGAAGSPRSSSALWLRAADGRGAGARSPGHGPQRRRPQPGAGPLRVRWRERHGRSHR